MKYLCSVASIVLLAVLLPAGCANPPEGRRQVKTTPAHEKLIKLCKEEFNLKVVTKAFEHTLWVYLPLDHSFLDLAASREGPVKSDRPEQKLVIKYLDGYFKDAAFTLRYDIGPELTYTDSKGISTKFSEEYTQKQQFLFAAISQAYSDVEKDPQTGRYVEKIAGDVDFMGDKKNATHKALVHSYVKASPVPDFFVITIADIAKGIEITMYVHLQDLLRARVDQGFSEEYARRVVVEQPVGHEAIIGDTSGEHLEARDLSWGEFLMKQMIYRVTFKYTQSSFPPNPDALVQLEEIAAETVKAYGFDGFEAVHFDDLNAKTMETLNKPALLAIETTPPNLPGKLHRIKFEIGAPEEE